MIRRVVPGLLSGVMLVAGCGGVVELPAPPGGSQYSEEREACAAHDPLRRAYFGDLHVHTEYSMDAHLADTRVTPEQAYRFAKGEPVALTPLDVNGQGTRSFRIDRPLDFAAVTDHSEFLGEVASCMTPGSFGYDSRTCQSFRGGGIDVLRFWGSRLTHVDPRLKDICGADGTQCAPFASEVWQRIQRVSEEAYDRTSACSFTSFVAYEYSYSPRTSNRHRNVIFRNANVPAQPISFYDQPTPQGMWSELRRNCLEAGIGCDVLAIPHNSNEGNGQQFLVEYPGAASPEEEREQAAFRAAMEPVAEIYQHKGDSECINGVSGAIAEPDELCDFEKRRQGPFEDCGEGTGVTGMTGTGCVSRLDYLRGVLLGGMQEQERLGANPFQVGFIGSTDTHNGTPGAVAEATFPGHFGANDDTPEKLLGPGVLMPGGIVFSPGGLAAVWAEENSRDFIFDALRRRETFGTSGTRIAVRLFGGWGLPAGLCGDPAMVRSAYALGVPMGGVLGAPPTAGAPPSFLVSALRDPGGAGLQGVPLQRIQIVKGWLEQGQGHWKVFDVVGDANNGAGVDEATCRTHGPGADSLCTVWTDPEFVAGRHAYYYARVLENPSCRWNTHACIALPADQRPPACSDPAVSKTIQERAWSSPIWYTPA